MPGDSHKNETRGYPRISTRLKVALMMSSEGQILAATRDISDGGLFVLLDSKKMPEIGENVNVQVQGLPDGMEAPWLEMQVVRVENDGVGLMIIKE